MVPKNTRQQNRCCRFDITTQKRGRFTENLSIYLSTPAPNSPLQNPSNFGVTASHWLLYFLLFSFFLIFKPDGCVEPYAWSLMRGDAFIHFVSGSRWVNIRLGVLLLIPKSPHPHVSMLLLLLKSRQWDVCTGRCCPAKETGFGSLPNFCCPGKEVWVE